MTWKPDPCHWRSKMRTDEAVCPKSRKGWVTKLRIKAQPLSPRWLATSQGDPFSSDWKISELLSKCCQHELSKTQQMGFFTLWLMKAWHMAWKIKSSLPGVHIYKIMFISTGLANKQDIFHPWKAVSVCMCKLATTTKSMTDDPNEHYPSEIQIVVTFCFRKESLFFTSPCKLLGLLQLYFSALDKNTYIIHPFVSCL